MEECMEVRLQLIKVSWVHKCVRPIEAKSLNAEEKTKCKNTVSEV